MENILLAQYCDNARAVVISLYFDPEMKWFEVCRNGLIIDLGTGRSLEYDERDAEDWKHSIIDENTEWGIYDNCKGEKHYSSGTCGQENFSNYKAAKERFDMEVTNIFKSEEFFIDAEITPEERANLVWNKTFDFR